MYNRSRNGFLITLGIASCVLRGNASAQTATTIPPPEEIIVLSPFEIKGEQPGRYQSVEAISGGRVRAEVFDAPQSISAIPRDLLDDVAANRIIDAAKYVSAITESVNPGGI